MLWALLVGLVIGIIAKFLMPGRDPGGFIITALLGVAGSLLANFIGAQMGMYQEGEPAGFVASIVGAVILLAIYRAVVGRNQTTIHQP
ncbi:MAG: GlsB/YeaQ/YmgE family stress response membrane protein [Bacteriovoracaceae bacterium]